MAHMAFMSKIPAVCESIRSCKSLLVFVVCLTQQMLQKASCHGLLLLLNHRSGQFTIILTCQTACCSCICSHV